jgi:hypothetical protein
MQVGAREVWNQLDKNRFIANLGGKHGKYFPFVGLIKMVDMVDVVGLLLQARPI